MKMRTILGVVALGFVMAGCGSTTGSAPAAKAVHGVRASKIDWQPWGTEVFAKAKRENKLVLVDVGIEGCTACRWMHEETYADAAIAEQIAEGFVAVSVDADVQPDLGERYEAWGWPATIFLTGDGVQVRALRGNRAPKVFAEILADVRTNRKAAKQEKPAAADEPVKSDLEGMCLEAHARLEKISDENGWGGDERIAYAPPVEHAFYRAHVHGEARLKTRALSVLAGQAKLIDPVWGGVFVASTTPDWSSPIVEKRTVQEADALGTFAEGYHATGDARWLDAAKSVHRYLHDWMLSPEGTFYSTQQDDAPGLPSNMSSTEYFKLSDKERRKFGTPPVDHGVYTDQNGPAIAAYVRLYEATGDRAMLDTAARAADALLRERQRADGTVTQFRPAGAVSTDARLRRIAADNQVHLKAQAEMGLALVALAKATGDARWTTAAQKIAKGTREALEDTIRGGFFNASARETDAMFERRKPFAENIQMARFLYRLSVLTKSADPKDAAVATVRSVATKATLEDQNLWGIAPYALLLEEMMSEPIEITVVTSKPDARADELFGRAVRMYEPRKVVRFDRPGKYSERGGKPTLYMCTTVACSPPVVDPSAIERVAAAFVAEPSAKCAISGGSGRSR